MSLASPSVSGRSCPFCGQSCCPMVCTFASALPEPILRPCQPTTAPGHIASPALKRSPTRLPPARSASSRQEPRPTTSPSSWSANGFARSYAPQLLTPPLGPGDSGASSGPRSDSGTARFVPPSPADPRSLLRARLCEKFQRMQASEMAQLRASFQTELKYAAYLCKFPSCPPATCRPTRRKVFRFVHASLDHPNNFRPVRLISPSRRLPGDAAGRCSEFGLSVYDTEQHALAAYAAVLKTCPNFPKTVGTHLAEVSLTEQDGLLGEPSRQGHADFHEYAVADLVAAAKVIAEIRIVKP